MLDCHTHGNLLMKPPDDAHNVTPNHPTSVYQQPYTHSHDPAAVLICHSQQVVGDMCVPYEPQAGAFILLAS